MSILQISKIQVRRGQKNSNSGIPQLSSAEFAWAIDSQELFIGNGSISEGAPYVGNTKILTEHDNIIALVNSYSYGGPQNTSSTPRSLQSKLDETVSVLDFGADPSGVSDSTTAFNNACTALYKSAENQNKKILFIPAGTYLFLSDLKIPSWAILQGEHSVYTILNIGSNNIRFVSEHLVDFEVFTDSNFPHDIQLSNITINHTSGQTRITASRSCKFSHVSWVSDYQLGDIGFVPENANGLYILPIVSSGGYISVSGVGVTNSIQQNFSTTHASTLSSLVGILNADLTFSENFVAVAVDSSLKIMCNSALAYSTEISIALTVSVQVDNLTVASEVTPVLSEYADGSENVSASVFWENNTFGTRTTSIDFYDCKFVNTTLAVKCLQYMRFDTFVEFHRSKWDLCDVGIFIVGVTPSLGISQGNYWNITDCRFEDIANYAMLSTNGIGTKISRSVFNNCGNGVNSAQFPVTAIVKFGESKNNVVVDCSSNRHQASAIPTSQSPSIAVVEFENASYANLIDRNYISVVTSDTPRVLTVLPLSTRFIIIDYFLSIGDTVLSKVSRIGKLNIAVGDDLAGEDNISNISISDQYSYSPSSPTDTGGAGITNFVFSASVGDIDSDSSIETLVLNYVNPINTGATGVITYSVSYGSV